MGAFGAVLNALEEQGRRGGGGGGVALRTQVHVATAGKAAGLQVSVRGTRGRGAYDLLAIALPPRRARQKAAS